jgi:ketosteroid isomerase-like protein
MPNCVIAGPLCAAALIVWPVSPLTAQPVDSAEAAIRAALTKWTDDFNAGDAQKACGLFSPELRYDYRGFPERNYRDVCNALQHALADSTKSYRYALDIAEIIGSGDVAVVRLTWILTVNEAGADPQVTRERGLDVFRKEHDGGWKIIRFIAYEELR